MSQKLSKEERRISLDNIRHCECGQEIKYVCWKWLKGSANVRHYAVICPACHEKPFKERPAIQWRNKIDPAVDAWNDYGWCKGERFVNGHWVKT